MIRLLSLLLMAGALAGFGFFAAERWRERLLVLQLFRQMVYHLRGRIFYANATLLEAFLEVGERFLKGRDGIFKEPGAMFLRVAKGLESDRAAPFFSVWEREVKGLPRDFPLSEADRLTLLSLGENLGYADRAMQERTILFYLEQTEKTMEELQGEVAERTKLCRCLGVAAGLFLLVIMV